MENSKRVLSVGLVCLDIMNICVDFPKEDSDQRLIDQNWQRGGNASNDAAVLNMLQVKCDFFGTLSKAPVVSYVREQCEELGINIDNCVLLDRKDFPISCVLINSKNGSRTIVHSNKNWEEPKAEDFKKIDLSKYRWIHFEGRNAQEVDKMIDIINEYNKSKENSSKRIIISVELEKKKIGVENLYSKVDYLFLGKIFAEANGFKSMQETVAKMKDSIKEGASVICAWGDQGACCWSPKPQTEERVLTSGIFPPENGLVDTLGAGDTFVSGTIFSLLRGRALHESITFGCKLAGAKCGVRGWNELKPICQKYCNDY